MHCDKHQGAYWVPGMRWRVVKRTSARGLSAERCCAVRSAEAQSSARASGVADGGDWLKLKILRENPKRRR
jgi:hypothetical protein